MAPPWDKYSLENPQERRQGGRGRFLDLLRLYRQKERKEEHSGKPDEKSAAVETLSYRAGLLGDEEIHFHQCTQSFDNVKKTLICTCGFFVLDKKHT